MANFPTEGTVGDPHEESGFTWIYDGTKWVKQSTQVTTDIVELSNIDLLGDLPVVDTVLPGAPEIFTNQNNANEYIVSCLKTLDENFSDYLPLTGGTVAGDVNIKGVLKIDRNDVTGEGEGFSIDGHLPTGVEGNYLLGVYHNGNDKDAGDAVNYNGRTDMDSNIQTKESVEALISNHVFIDEGSVKKIGDTMTGTLNIGNNTDDIKLNFTDSTSDIALQGNWMVKLKASEIIFSQFVNMSDHQIINLALATSSKHAVSVAYLPGSKVVVAGVNSLAKSGGFYYDNGKLFYKI